MTSKTLKPAGQIDPLPPWMMAAETQAVMAALHAGAAADETKALFVGGCVRNAVLGKEADDIDIATTWPPLDATQLLKEAGIKVIPTGIDHGTVTAIIHEKAFQITTLRRDVKTSGRHAVVSFTHDWREDAARRDFTMNTLLSDGAGRVYDPTGRGLKDLKAGCVLFVGDPQMRIREDYLRILRFFRFHAWYGRGAPDAAALAACRKMARHVRQLSRERITAEIIKILSLEDPSVTLEFMFKNKVMPGFSHKNYKAEALSIFCHLQKRYGMFDVPARLALLAGLDRAGLAGLETWLSLSTRHRKMIAGMMDAYESLKEFSEKSAKILIYKQSAVLAGQAILIAGALGGPTREVESMIRVVQTWTPPVFPLNGHDLMAAGVKSGPEMGEIIFQIEDWWIAEDFKPDAAACRAYLLSLLR